MITQVCLLLSPKPEVAHFVYYLNFPIDSFKKGNMGGYMPVANVIKLLLTLLRRYRRNLSLNHRQIWYMWHKLCPKSFIILATGLVLVVLVYFQNTLTNFLQSISQLVPYHK
jgi:hypothetical protein